MKKKKIEVIDLNNQPKSENLKKDKLEVKKGFNPVPQAPIKNDNGLRNYKGRAYKIIDKNFGMWGDNGKIFNLKDIGG